MAGRPVVQAQTVQPADLTTEEPMDRPQTARRLLGLALGFGVLADALFDGPAFGINLLIAVVALVAAAVAVRRPNAPFERMDAWLPVSAVVLAGFVALRSDPVLIALDTVVVLGLTGASIAAVGGLAVTRLTTNGLLDLFAWLTLAVLDGARKPLRPARRELGVPRAASEVVWRSGPVLRGLALATPLVLIFVVLFASADLIFGRWLETALTFDIDLAGLPGRVVFVGVVAWAAAGVLWLGATIAPPPEPQSLGAAVASAEVVARSRPGSLGAIEAVVVLVTVDVLFAIFVVLQVAYLFGGADTRGAAGLTFSDYARRGFFELLVASALAGSIVAGLEATVRERPRAYVATALALLALTLFMLVSAVARMRLYQEAYGWTELRFYALAGISFVGLGLLASAVLLVRDRSDRLPHALIGAFLVVLLAINVVGPRGFVADRNIDRALHPERIPADGERSPDYAYLVSLGDDAIPAIVDVLPALSASVKPSLVAHLDARRVQLATDRALVAPQAWNLARERARAALERLPRR
jgi:hypothetical protein